MCARAHATCSSEGCHGKRENLNKSKDNLKELPFPIFLKILFMSKFIPLIHRKRYATASIRYGLVSVDPEEVERLLAK